MKTLFNILIAPFKLIKWLITISLDIVGSVITFIGLLFYGLSYVIKDYKTAKQVTLTFIKTMLANKEPK